MSFAAQAYAAHPYKVNHCYAVLDGQGFTRADRQVPRVSGFMLHDTRHIATYLWDMTGFELIEGSQNMRGLTQFWSRFTDHEQDLLIRRTLIFREDGFDEQLTVRNEARTALDWTPLLTVDADFADAFEQRGRVREIGRNEVIRDDLPGAITFRYVAQDAITPTTVIRAEGFAFGERLIIPARGECVLQIAARFNSGLTLREEPAPRLHWSSAAKALRQTGSPGVAQAMTDIEALAASTPEGPFILTGIPNYVTVFGRDSLLTAWFLLDAAPDIAVTTLRHLAAHQGQVTDAFRQEEPGKIAHEVRVSELARMNDVPFARYYGTTDATMLFLILLRDHARKSGSMDVVIGLAHNWAAALAWVEQAQGPDGLVRYRADASGKGLLNTSWKDSDDSVSYADGRLARGRIAVVEIQGYAAAALTAAADLTEMTGGAKAEVARLRGKAADLAEAIDRLFWNETLGLHAIAIDEDGVQCDTATSNPGHLLWAGILSPNRAAQVADRMLQPDLWSGWGLRTLSSDAARYKPLSYHNGSVWPHDTAIFAAGLHRYGLTEQSLVVTSALIALAERQPGHQMPELCGGYERGSDTPPLIYIETCRPQAWSAAATVWAGMVRV